VLRTLTGVVALVTLTLASPPIPGAARPASGGGEGAVRSVVDGLRLPPDTETARGSWRLSTVNGDAALVWRSPAPIPITDARVELRLASELGSRVVAVPELVGDRRGLRVGVDELAGLDTSRLQVWLGADRLDRGGLLAPRLRERPPTGTRGVQDVPVEVLDSDPGARGRFDVLAAFDYRAQPLPWREFKAPMEVRGHVVLPDRQDSAPLVLFLHGRHLPCYGGNWSGRWPCDRGSRPVPSLRGYQYLQHRLASRGYASVSIAANAINAQDLASLDGGAGARSKLVRHHLGLLGQWDADPARQRLFGRLDLDRTVLVGHSRGGEGVAHAMLDTGPAAPYDVRGEVLVAPTNFARVATPFIPSVTLLPYCDGDVIDLQGQTYTDVARDLVTGDTAFRSSVLMRGANHNFFNTEWTPRISQAPSNDDWFDGTHPLCGRDAGTRLSAAEQRVAGTSWVSAAVRLFVRGDTDMLDHLDAAGAVTVPKLPGAAVWTHAIGGDRELVRPGAGGDATARGARLCRAATGSSFFRSVLAPATTNCGRGLSELRTVHWFPAPPGELPLPRELQVGWRQPGATGGLVLRQPLDLSGATTTLDLRTAVDPRRGPARFRVRLTDVDGDGWTSPRVALTTLGGGFIRTWWAQTVRITLDAVPPAVDLAQVQRVELVSSSADARGWVLDAAARRPALLPVTERRVPAVSLERVVVREGDTPRAIRVPWHLDSPSPVRARFAVVVWSSTPAARPGLHVVDVEAGADHGTLPVWYWADQTDDRDREYLELIALPLRNLTGGQTSGRVVVRDDDQRAAGTD